MISNRKLRIYLRVVSFKLLELNRNKLAKAYQSDKFHVLRPLTDKSNEFFLLIVRSTELVVDLA